MNLLNCIGLGSVAATKDTNTDEIMVYLPGFFPGAEGRISANLKEVETSGVDSTGQEIRTKTLRSNAVPATWKNMGDNNRLTSPDVREGTKVAIYQITGQNRYYWTLDGVNADTYRLETVIYGWSANPNLDENAPFDVNNFYIMKVSTHDGLIALRTSMSNNEKSRFDIQVDAMRGRFTLAGNEGSYLALDDVVRSFTYTNRDKAYLHIEKKKMTVSMPLQLNLFTEDDINIKTKTLNLQTNALNVDAKLTQWKGDIELFGNIKQKGDMDRDGKSHTTGLVSTDNDFKSPSITQETHVHGNVQNGNGRTSRGQ